LLFFRTARENRHPFLTPRELLLPYIFKVSEVSPYFKSIRKKDTGSRDYIKKKPMDHKGRMEVGSRTEGVSDCRKMILSYLLSFIIEKKCEEISKEI